MAYDNLVRLVWREHEKGPGVATFEYHDGGHDHRAMSQYEAANLAQAAGLVQLNQEYEVREWVRLADHRSA